VNPEPTDEKARALLDCRHGVLCKHTTMIAASGLDPSLSKDMARNQYRPSTIITRHTTLPIPFAQFSINEKVNVC